MKPCSPRIFSAVICKNTPMDVKTKVAPQWLSKVVVFLSKICPPQADNLAQFIYTFSGSTECLFVMLIYAITANGVWLPLLVPPLAHYCFFHASCSFTGQTRMRVLPARLPVCFLLYITTCFTALIGGYTFERKAPFATISCCCNLWLLASFPNPPIPQWSCGSIMYDPRWKCDAYSRCTTWFR